MSNNREYDYLFKLVIIGDSGVGKSSLLMRFSDDQFTENYITTIGVDFRFKTLKIDGKALKLQIWDTAGQERFRTITNAYYKGADAIIVVYDTTNKPTFESIDNYWINEIESFGEQDAELMLIGNKCDLNKSQIPTDTAQQYAKNRKMEFFETSAKTAQSVELAFETIAKKLMIKKDLKTQEKKNRKRSSRTNSQKTKETKETEEPEKETSQNLWQLRAQPAEKKTDRCC